MLRRLLVVGLLVWAHVATASVFLPLSLDELAVSSAAVIVGEVTRIDVVQNDAGAIETEISVQVFDSLRGTLSGSVVSLREPGGALGSVRDYVSGAAQFEVGEEVLLFLVADAGGRLRVHQGALGKFRLVASVSGLHFERSVDEHTAFLLPEGADAPAQNIDWTELRATLDSLPKNGVRQQRRISHGADRGSGGFRITQAGRFFEPDEGIPVDFRVYGIDPAIGGVASYAAIDAAMTAWNGVDGSTIDMRRNGTTGDPGRACPGPNKVMFGDPEGLLAPPVDCRGELTRGIQRTTRFESKSFNGIELERVSCGFLVLADGWEACEVWNECNVAEIAAHELGHVLGLGHSSEDPNEADESLRDATMYYRAHFDGRCGGVRPDDVGGVRFLYPAALPPTITTASPLQNGLPGMFYSTVLEATGGSGTFMWTIVGGGFPGIDVSADGTLSGTPEVNGTSFFQVRAVDSNGDNHVKVLSFTSGTPGPVAPTATRSATVSPTASVSPTVTETPATTPTPMPSVSSTPTVLSDCPGDCEGSGTVTVDEILVLVSVALGGPGLDGCRAGDLDGSNSITVDEIVQAVSAALEGCPAGSMLR